MTKLKRMLRWMKRGGNPSVLRNGYLLPAEAMWATLERERLRADRNNSVFSLLALDAPPEMRDELVGVMQRRLRSTDVVGLLRDEQLGVFLPDTPEAGAKQVAHDLLELLKPDTPRPQHEIYVYPQPWWPDSESEEEVEQPLQVGNGRVGGQRAGDDSQRRVGTSGGGILRAQSQLSLPLRSLYAQPVPAWKRGLDIAGAVFGITMLSPVLVATAVCVKLTSPGPIIYRQQRAGLGGRAFTIWKFRTMCDFAELQQVEIMHLNEQDGAAFKIKDDPRITPLGKILRKTSIDEFPQLWNVLRGEMSLVGPRPLPMHEADACAAWQQRRLDVTPGLTCIWQVEGRSTVKFEQWMRMDLQYARKRSLVSDLRLIIKTIPAVLLRRGAS